ncbi:hypothetical protein HPT25_17555 [Bacillus sp. BRMEA1]|uniref:hypothetical protein n=1 Tax=Neobacillus endophyticus TaxID=2738405 RepID=UPI0015664C33|nr:hypothetical protein [Neobacillus endophyticus]NRD79167.1 hypothetical protein [Neobacillus endophyticus]
MRLQDVQPQKNFSYIFVQFPGMKMNVPTLSNSEGKAVKEEIALCVQLSSKQKVDDVYLVHTNNIKPFDFTDEEIGAKASYRVIKKKEDSLDSPLNKSENRFTWITEELAIVQKKTETGYDFVLVINNTEIGKIASIEEEFHTAANIPLQHNKEVEEELAANKIKNKKRSVFGILVSKRTSFGDRTFQENECSTPIRIYTEEWKRKVTGFSPAALDFIGPGDHNQPSFMLRGG